MTVKMSHNYCMENGFNNVKSPPDLNFYILPSEKQLVGLRLVKMEKFGTRLGLQKNNIINHVCSEHIKG